MSESTYDRFQREHPEALRKAEIELAESEACTEVCREIEARLMKLVAPAERKLLEAPSADESIYWDGGVDLLTDAIAIVREIGGLNETS